MRLAVDKGPPLSKTLIGVTTDLVSSGPGGSEANNNYLKRHAASFLRIFFTLSSLDRLPLLLV
jgi:hypothetical protein